MSQQPCNNCQDPHPGKIVRTYINPKNKDESLCAECGRVVASFPTQNTEGLRFNASKPQLSYNSLGLEVQKGEAAVWEFGAKKYARGNWLKGMSWSGSADSLRRHLDAFLNGEDLDPETGLPHVDHLICCAKIMSNSYHTRPDLDDRSKNDD